MRKRCYDRTDRFFDRYGGRGITVCDRWRGDFAAFLADMGPRPSPHHSIDRINNDGNYEPGNCRWATLTEQNRNTSRNRTLTLRGVARCVSEWAELLRMSVATIFSRLRLGWSDERTLTTPARPKRQHAPKTTPSTV